MASETRRWLSAVPLLLRPCTSAAMRLPSNPSPTLKAPDRGRKWKICARFCTTMPTSLASRCATFSERRFSAVSVSWCSLTCNTFFGDHSISNTQVTGYRAPWMMPGGDDMMRQMAAKGFDHDSTLTSRSLDPPIFPYTLDYLPEPVSWP